MSNAFICSQLEWMSGFAAPEHNTIRWLRGVKFQALVAGYCTSFAYASNTGAGKLAHWELP